MNIKDFLIDNYIWILVIILITIVTIIGFLADKKKGGNKKENKLQQSMPTPKNMEPQPVNNGQPMQYQQSAQPEMNMNQTNNNNNMQMNYNNMNATTMQTNQMNSILNNNGQNIGTIPQPANIVPNMVGTMNNPQPVENLTGNVEKESMYQPLSEQTPNITPQPVPNFTTMQNNNMAQNINQMQPTMPSAEQLVPTPEVINQNNMQMPTYNTQTPMQSVNNNSGVNPNMMPNNNTTIPQPVNSIPTPQPVMPQSIMSQPVGQGSYNQQQMMPQNLSQQTQQPTSNVTTPQPTQQAPVNFVFGPQNNNQNM